MATKHVGIRAGSDIAFLGGIANYILRNDLYFREYVERYTNAPVIIDETFADTEDLDGLFSGWDPEEREYEIRAGCTRGWSCTARPGSASRGSPTKGERRTAVTAAASSTASRPRRTGRCSTRVASSSSLKKHYARYTPEFVADTCGCPVEDFLEVCETLVDNSGRERTSAFCYAVGWTQHTVGVQTIRSAAIVQQLLGNIGRPGGGIMALRGHASIQGSTDIPTLYNILPGYLPMPHTETYDDLDSFTEANTSPTGWWGNFRAYWVSLMKAYFGENANARQRLLLPVAAANRRRQLRLLDARADARGEGEGLHRRRREPGGGARQRQGAPARPRRLEWLVVRDLVEIESAAFWYDSPEIESGELKPEEIATEVFFLPAAAHIEKDGSFTNTQRLLQWHCGRSSRRRTAARSSGSTSTSAG